MKHTTAVLLHNIRSAHNVGSIFRTADAAGVSKIYLSGYTPRPVDRFGRPQKDIAKVALGAEQSVSWEYEESPEAIIARMRSLGWTIAGAEQDPRSVDYRSFSPTTDTLVLFGEEVAGIAPALRDACDIILEIPMHGEKESLNVSVCAGIVLFALQG